MDRTKAFVVIPIAGLVHDLVTSDAIGTSVLAMLPLIAVGAIVQLRIVDSDFIPTVAAVAAASLAYGMIALAILAATGEPVPWLDGMLRVVAPSIVVNALFTPIVYLPVHWFGTKSTARILGPGRITPAITAKRSG